MKQPDNSIPVKRGRKKKTHPGGRPLKFSPELGASICGLLRKGVSRKDACKELGISYQTMHNWITKGEAEQDLSENRRTEFFGFWISVNDIESCEKAPRAVPTSATTESTELYRKEVFEDTILKNPFVFKKTPTKKQTEFLFRGIQARSKSDQNGDEKPIEVFFDGALQAGKTVGLIMAALQYVENTKYHALLVRPDYYNLEKSIMRKVDEWISDTHAKWDENKLTWKFPSGACLTFGYLHEPENHHKFSDKKFQFIGCDDLTVFTREEYMKLFCLLHHRPHSRIPLRIFSTGNACGPNPFWVKERFINPSPEEMVKYNRYTVSVGLEENPHSDPANIRQWYKDWHQLMAAQLLDGSWELENL